MGSPTIRKHTNAAPHTSKKRTPASAIANTYAAIRKSTLNRTGRRCREDGATTARPRTFQKVNSPKTSENIGIQNLQQKLIKCCTYRGGNLPASPRVVGSLSIQPTHL